MIAKFLGNSWIFSMSCEIFLGIPGILVDFDDLFSWILQKIPRICWKLMDAWKNSWEIIGFWCHPVIFSQEFVLFFLYSGENLLLDATGIPRNLWIFSGWSRKFLGNSRIFSMFCEIFLGIPGILVDFDDSVSWILQKIPKICGKLMDTWENSWETIGFWCHPVIFS